MAHTARRSTSAHRSHWALALIGLTALGCGSAPAPSPERSPEPPPVTLEAGFLDVPARDVTLNGKAVSIEAEGRLFYNLRPADDAPEDKPILVLFNGYADDIVRPFGTGPTTVAEGGAVVANPSSFTRFANLLYVEPRQSGYSYDVLTGRAPGPGDCSPDVFNEYVDAADVLLAVLSFLDAHPRLSGPVYWVGESYAGVRITWLLTYLHGRWDLAPYADPVLASRIAAVRRTGSIAAGQILLESWLAGSATAAATSAECLDPAEIAAVSASLGTTCEVNDACACASDNGRSLYNFAYTTAHQTQRVLEADEALTLPDRAKALLGLPLTSIPRLGPAERSKGFKCSPPDDTVPSDAAIVAELGALPAGQTYYVPYSPLLPGKETAPTSPDWYTQNYQGPAFLDDLHDVPAFLTKGDLDLVVPTLALAPALRAVAGAARIDTTSASRIGVRYPDGERFIEVHDYPSAGHMISMLEPAQLATDVEGWLAKQRP